MYYIYLSGNDACASEVEPQVKYFMVDKLPPIPNKKYQKLYADFENEIVWYDTRELTEEEIKQERIEEIKTELGRLDERINRATEDLYSLTNTTPYTTVQEAINKKEELRLELKNLTKVGE